ERHGRSEDNDEPARNAAKAMRAAWGGGDVWVAVARAGTPLFWACTPLFWSGALLACFNTAKAHRRLRSEREGGDQTGRTGCQVRARPSCPLSGTVSGL